MKAYLVHNYGKDSKFIAAEVDKPSTIPNHVVIKVMATSLNPVDHKILTMDLGINPEPPAILHMDVAGTIAEVGEGVDDFKVGDEVFGCAGGLQGPAGKIDGALADFMLADVNLIAHKPKTIAFEAAAALPLVSITAWEGLIDRAKITKDDHILVHGGTGGVGHMAIQIAKAHGAQVTATVSTEEKAKIARSLGVDNIILYRSESVEEYVQRLTDGRGFDVVFDTIGGDNLDKSFEAVRTSGQVIGTIGHNKHDLSQMHLKGLSMHIVFMLLPMLTGTGRAHHGEILTNIAKLVDQGKLQPLLHERTFDFDTANEAHELFASGKYLGKIVLTR